MGLRLWRKVIVHYCWGLMNGVCVLRNRKGKNIVLFFAVSERKVALGIGCASERDSQGGRNLVGGVTSATKFKRERERRKDRLGARARPRATDCCFRFDCKRRFTLARGALPSGSSLTETNHTFPFSSFEHFFYRDFLVLKVVKHFYTNKTWKNKYHHKSVTAIFVRVCSEQLLFWIRNLPGEPMKNIKHRWNEKIIEKKILCSGTSYFSTESVVL